MGEQERSSVPARPYLSKTGAMRLIQFAFLKVTSGKNFQIVNNLEVFLSFEDTFLKLRIVDYGGEHT
jgi:hypothetical protein